MTNSLRSIGSVISALWPMASTLSPSEPAGPSYRRPRDDVCASGGAAGREHDVAVFARADRPRSSARRTRKAASVSSIYCESIILKSAPTGGHDFHPLKDRGLWAHESQDLLLSARSGARIEYRTGRFFCNATTHLPR
jgi:hypothetical protein